MIVWKGPSEIDGKPIFVSISEKSKNSKTGDMVQVFILNDNDKHPQESIKTGEDRAICGDCPFRPVNDGVCYASRGTAGMGMASHWRANRGKMVAPWAEIDKVVSGRMVRLGAYGDPAVVPYDVLRRLLTCASGHTGYTSQHAKCNPIYRTMLMASAKSAAEAVDLQRRGWRTFRVQQAGEIAKKAGEIVCPNTTRGIQCQDCGLCDGTKADDKRKNIVIAAHGSGKNNFVVREVPKPKPEPEPVPEPELSDSDFEAWLEIELRRYD